MSTTDKNDQVLSPKKLKELCAMQPNDPFFHIQLAKHFSQTGHEISAIYSARKAYQILIKEYPKEAKQLVDTFGIEITASSTKPLMSAGYLPLASTFGAFATSRRKINLKEGEMLFRKGSQAKYIYLILEGELAVSNDDINNPSLLNYLHSGDLVGEGAILKQPIRSATIIANANSTLLKFSPQELKQAFKKHPELHMLFSKEALLRRRVAELSSSRIFGCLPTDLRFMLAKRAWDMSYSAGQVIKESLVQMPYVELISSGIVSLYDKDENNNPLYCGRLTTHDILGLHHIMSGQTSKLSYVAKTTCNVICMDYSNIEGAMEVSHLFRERVRDSAAKLASHVTRTMTLTRTIT